ncbi:hypothetical protein ACWCY1_35840, partial [Streptomyces goshikiensis]
DIEGLWATRLSAGTAMIENVPSSGPTQTIRHTRRAVNVARILKTALPMAAALSLIAATPAAAADYKGCNSRACAGVYNYRILPVSGGWYELRIDNVVVTDTYKNDGHTPYLQIKYTTHDSATHAKNLWGSDDGETAYLGDVDLFDVASISTYVCATGGSGCKRIA